MVKNLDIEYEDIERMIGSLLRGVSVYGYDREDLFLEGVLASLRAIEKYDYKYEVKLSTFIYTNIKNHYYYLYRKSRAQKRMPKEKINLESTLIAESGNFYGKELVSNENQEKDYIQKEKRESLIKKIEGNLKIEDQKIIVYILNGYSKKEISDMMDIEYKKLCNKVAYLKIKLKKIYEN